MVVGNAWRLLILPCGFVLFLFFWFVPRRLWDTVFIYFTFGHNRNRRPITDSQHKKRFDKKCPDQVTRQSDGHIYISIQYLCMCTSLIQVLILPLVSFIVLGHGMKRLGVGPKCNVVLERRRTEGSEKGLEFSQIETLPQMFSSSAFSNSERWRFIAVAKQSETTVCIVFEIVADLRECSLLVFVVVDAMCWCLCYHGDCVYCAVMVI